MMLVPSRAGFLADAPSTFPLPFTGNLPTFHPRLFSPNKNVPLRHCRNGTLLFASRESGIDPFTKLLGDVFLYAATFFLGLTLGILCEANTLLDPTVLKLLLLGMLALTISALGGLLGGYILYFWTGGKYNPMIGIAGVSCVPTTAKVVQKIASNANAGAIILPHALGANISGVITTAIIAATYVALLR